MATEHPEPEPFINADEAAKFLSMKRITVMRLALAGILPAHPMPRGKGNFWFFRRSELATFMLNRVHSQASRPFVTGKAAQ